MVNRSNNLPVTLDETPDEAGILFNDVTARDVSVDNIIDHY